MGMIEIFSVVFLLLLIAYFLYRKRAAKPIYHRGYAVQALSELYGGGVSVKGLSVDDYDNGAGQHVVTGLFQYKGKQHKFVIIFGAGTSDIIKITIDKKQVFYDNEKAWKYAEINDRIKNPHKYK